MCNYFAIIFDCKIIALSLYCQSITNSNIKKNKVMKKETVLEFLRSECQMGNSIIISTMGNGGAGLTVLDGDVSDFIEELSDMDHVDDMAEPEDIEDYAGYDPHYYRIHRFDGDNGFYVLVATYMDDVEPDFPDETVTEDSEYWFIDLKTGAGIGFYPKSDWTLEESLQDQKKVNTEQAGF